MHCIKTSKFNNIIYFIAPFVHFFPIYFQQFTPFNTMYAASTLFNIYTIFFRMACFIRVICCSLRFSIEDDFILI